MVKRILEWRLWCVTLVFLFALWSAASAQAQDDWPLPKPTIDADAVFTERYQALAPDEQLVLLDRYEAVFDETTPRDARIAFLTERLKVYRNADEISKASDLATHAFSEYKKNPERTDETLQLLIQIANIYELGNDFDQTFEVIYELQDTHKEKNGDEEKILCR